jgi:hypothetical protein
MDAFCPFYDKFADRFRISFIGKLVLSILLGFCFLGLRYISVMNSGDVKKFIFGDWSWFLALLITVVMFCLYYATHVFRNMIPEVLRRIPQDVTEEDIVVPIVNTLTNRGFVICGVIFGVVNCCMGITFGIPGDKWFAASTLLFGYFLAGFVNGLAVFGIYGVLASIKNFSDKIGSSIDFTSPDRCGDTAFLGTALMVFSSVTLIAGVMISIYILKAPWVSVSPDENVEFVLKAPWGLLNKNLVNVLKAFWITFPYMMAFVVLVVPALEINKILRKYKIRNEGELQKKLVTLQNEIENPETVSKIRKEKQDDYNYFLEKRKKLYNMRTWPFSASANAKFLSVISVNICTTVAGSYKWVNKIYTEMF